VNAAAPLARHSSRTAAIAAARGSCDIRILDVVYTIAPSTT
jgi:hypothetical protein